MSENSQNKNVKDDEIDLLDLFRRMGRTLSTWGKAIGRAFLISVVFLLRRWIWLLLSVIIGVGVSWFIKGQNDKIYTSELSLKSNAVPNSDMITYINRLHRFCVEKDNLALETELSLPPEKVRLIIDIQAFWVIDLLNDGIPDQIDYTNSFISNDTVNIRMEDRFIVQARLTDPQAFPLLRESILKYTRQNALFQQKNQIRLVQNKEIQARLVYDIAQLDSLQKVKYFEETRSRVRSSGGQMIFLQEQKTQLIYPDIHELYTKKQIIDTDLELYTDISTLLDDFSQTNRAINDTLFYGKRYVPIFFIGTLILLIIFANLKKLKEVYKKY